MATQPTREELAQSIGQLIRRKRQEKGLSVYKLSMITFLNAYHANAIHEYEKGTKIPDVETLNKIFLSLDLNLIETLNNL